LSEILKNFVAVLKPTKTERWNLLMNTLTNLVIKLQETEKGSVAWDSLFTEVYLEVQPSIESIVNGYSYSLRGDVHAGESEAINHLMISIDKFQYTGFEFLTFYKKTLRNKLIDLIRQMNKKSMKHNTSYDVSLSATVEEDASLLSADKMQDEALQTTDNYFSDSEESLTAILDEFTNEKPVEAGVIDTLITYSAEGYLKKDLTSALANYYEVEKYNGTVQKRVSRAREAFKKFCEEKGFCFNF
jgi:DNA-directed RNA polymerase specialized sigma24 family protein